MPRGVYIRTKPFTEEHKRKLSIASSNRIVSEETKAKMSKSSIGLKRKPFTEEHKQKIKNWHIGRKFTMEHKLKIRDALKKRVENGLCHLWKGGVTPINKAIRKSFEYRVWREAVFKRDNYTCQECKGFGKYLNADHIKPFALYPELRFELTNGRTLCVECHRKTETYGIKTSYAKKSN